MKTPALVQSNWKIYQYKKCLGYPQILTYILEGIKSSKKLELHFDLCENKSYSTFEAEAGLFYAQKSIEETVSFLQIENVW